MKYSNIDLYPIFLVFHKPNLRCLLRSINNILVNTFIFAEFKWRMLHSLALLFIHCLENPQISWAPTQWPMTDQNISDSYFFSAKYFIAWTGFLCKYYFNKPARVRSMKHINYQANLASLWSIKLCIQNESGIKI